MLTPESRFSHNAGEVAAQVIGGEAILINLSSGIYYSIDQAGADIWSLLAGQHSLQQIADAIAERYAVDAARARDDASALAESLLAENILAPVTGDTAATPIDSIAGLPATGQQLPYQTPKLNIYRDMGDLLALDPPMPSLDDVPWRPSGR